jgi:hypothetical protein
MYFFPLEQSGRGRESGLIITAAGPRETGRGSGQTLTFITGIMSIMHLLLDQIMFEWGDHVEWAALTDK